ncbi:MAG: zinc ribbon domain-containing protein [Candidatus Heimdallarchaeaceae archaeon]
MKIEENNEQKKLKNGKQKDEKSGKTNCTLQTPFVSCYQTVRVRIKTERMTAWKCDRLRLITNRDTRISNDYLRIIKHNEEKILRTYGTVNKTILDNLTLTTSAKTNNKLRTTVPHDLKKRYPRCSHDEFQECSEKAIQAHNGWKTLQSLTKIELNRPGFKKKTPRTQLLGKYPFRFQVRDAPKNTVTKKWLEIRDSLDSKRSGRRCHKRLLLPLAMSPYHEKKLKLGKIKMLELVYNSEKLQWSAHFTIQYSVPLYQSTQPPAVLGIDLGIKKTAVAVLLTPTGKVTMDNIRFIVDKDLKQKIRHLDNRINSIQSLLATRNNNGQPTKQLNVKLYQLRRRIRTIKEQELGYAVNQLVSFILLLKKRYNLFISVGYPGKIRKSHPRGNGNKSLRSGVHKWRFRLFVTKLKQKLASYGFESHRVVAIDESWTSKTCSRCDSINTIRTGQGQFNCLDCSYELNADLNGAKNIGKRLIQHSLKPKYGYTSIHDKVSNEFLPIVLFKCLAPLSQWLEDSSKNASSL